MTDDRRPEDDDTPRFKERHQIGTGQWVRTINTVEELHQCYRNEGDEYGVYGVHILHAIPSDAPTVVLETVRGGRRVWLGGNRLSDGTLLLVEEVGKGWTILTPSDTEPGLYYGYGIRSDTREYRDVDAPAFKHLQHPAKPAPPTPE